jgi:hypothetical protein
MSSDAVAAQRQCISKCPFLPRGEKLVWRIFFLHFISHIFYHQSFAPIHWLTKNKRCLWLIGQKISKKYYLPERLGQCQNMLKTLKMFLLFS